MPSEWIIPAYAGSTGWISPGRRRCKDHPRIRGEHSAASPSTSSAAGSSPHTRGARHTGRVFSCASRIIPAYAGSTSGMSSFSCRVWDHPRIRGEHGTPRNPSARSNGSSPHTRGARAFPRPTLVWGGIIPAYAGSTRWRPRYCHGGGDHPRIRGEHFTIEWEVKPGRGSSPHTRGARLPRRAGRRRQWIIPAYAGSTRAWRRSGNAPRDHPRIRGEHWLGSVGS